jgi:hypothetical protein
MRVTVAIVGLGILAFAGCDRSKAQGPEMVKDSPGLSLEQVQVPEKVGPGSVSASGEKRPLGSPDAIQVGMSREALVDTLSDCAERVVFVPANGLGGKAVEIFQPRAGPCTDHFRDRRFTVVGGNVHEVQPGRDELASQHPL